MHTYVHVRTYIPDELNEWLMYVISWMIGYSQWACRADKTGGRADRTGGRADRTGGHTHTHKGGVPAPSHEMERVLREA